MTRSGPHHSRMGNAQFRQVLTDVRSDCGQVSAGPSGVAAQSSERISAPISPPPARKSSAGSETEAEAAAASGGGGTKRLLHGERRGRRTAAAPLRAALPPA